MGDCVLWPGAVSEGYGKIGKKRVHRLAWESAYGPIPPGHVIHHECGNKLCVDVAHLRCMSIGDHMREHDNVHRARAVRVANAVGQTHCKRGHPYSEHGYVRPSFSRDAGTRLCMECQRINRARPFLPQSPTFARALAMDGEPIRLDEDTMTIEAGEET